jgi:hypothetical protein
VRGQQVYYYYYYYYYCCYYLFNFIWAIKKGVAAVKGFTAHHQRCPTDSSSSRSCARTHRIACSPLNAVSIAMAEVTACRSTTRAERFVLSASVFAPKLLKVSHANGGVGRGGLFAALERIAFCAFALEKYISLTSA